MENQFDTPSEEQYTEPQNVEQVTDNHGQAETEEQQVEQQVQPAESYHQQNYNNGARRIRQRESMKARIRELEERLSQYEGKTDDMSRFQAGQLRERIDDMTAIEADGAIAEYEDRTRQFFGDATPQVMQQLEHYAEYVDQAEPDLKRYLHREYGPILMHEWCKRMDQPALRGQWLNMTQYEKGAVLNNFYKQIVDRVTQYRNRTQAVPVPSGGRQTSNSVPTDDFGIELGNAFNRHRKR